MNNSENNSSSANIPNNTNNQPEVKKEEPIIIDSSTNQNNPQPSAMPQTVPIVATQQPSTSIPQPQTVTNNITSNPQTTTINPTPPITPQAATPTIQTTSTAQVQPEVVVQASTNTNPQQQILYTQAPSPQNSVPTTSEPAAIRNTNLAEQPKKQPGPFRYFLLVMFFISLAALVWFLPDIRAFMMEQEVEEKRELIHGTMRCVYEEEDELITTLYTSEFLVDNNKIKQYTSLVESKGESGSEEDLNRLNEKCEMLTTMVKGISGIKSSCSLNSRKQTSTQVIDYNKVDIDNLSSAYSEAGGIVPDYSLDDDAIEIKKEMTLSGYNCTVS